MRRDSSGGSQAPETALAGFSAQVVLEQREVPEGWLSLETPEAALQ